MPRSGTSWVGQCLSHAPGFTYYREPDNDEHVAAAQRRFRTLYLARGDHDADYYRLMERAISGGIATAFTMKHDPGPLLRRLPRKFLSLGEAIPFLFFRRRHVLLKMVRANLTLDWIAAEFPEVRIVYLVRHPCGQFESWKRLGWEPKPTLLLNNERLMGDHLMPYRDVLASASTFWERAGAYWGAINFVVHRQYPTAVDDLVAFEWLCADPIANFKNLYSRLDVEWNETVEKFLRQADASREDRPYSLARRTMEQIDKWVSRLTAREVEECRRYATAFDMPFYPKFDPCVATASASAI